jgi:hypothetical protein
MVSPAACIPLPTTNPPQVRGPGFAAQNPNVHKPIVLKSAPGAIYVQNGLICQCLKRARRKVLVKSVSPKPGEFLVQSVRESPSELAISRACLRTGIVTSLQ